MINVAGQSKIESIKYLINQKSTATTVVNFTGAGRIRSFPTSKYKRFVVPSSDFYQVITRPGAYLDSDVTSGQNSVSFDYLPSFDKSVSFNFSTVVSTASTVENNKAYFDNSINKNLTKGDFGIFRTYSIEIDGDYPAGTRQMAFLSSLPLVIGDQLSFYDGLGNGHQAVITKSNKTQNQNQWDITLDGPVPFKIEDGTEIFMEASAVQYWDSIPIDVGPCLLQLPIATHRSFSQTDEIAISYVRLKTGDLERESFYISENVIQIPNVNIPSSAWLSSTVINGTVDFKERCSQFVLDSSGEFYARLNFIDALDGNRIESWQFNVNCLTKGRISVKVNETVQIYEVKPGLQTLLFVVPDEKINFIDFMSNVQVSFGGIVCTNAVSNIDLSIHLFNPITMHSHVIGRPGLVEVLASPNPSWAVEGKAAIDSGYKLKPAIPRPTPKTLENEFVETEKNIFLTPSVSQISASGTQDFEVSFSEDDYYESFDVELTGTDSTDMSNNPVAFASTYSIDLTTITITAGNAGETGKLKVTSTKTGKVAIADFYIV